MHLPNLRKNFLQLYKQASPAEILVSLKANAYGCGAGVIARYLEKTCTSGLHGFAVANVEEALELREDKVSRPIYILSGVQSPTKEVFRYLVTHSLVPIISSISVLRVLAELSSQESSPIPIHLKFNTGMNRLGINLDEWKVAQEILLNSKGLVMEGVLSHYASSNKPNALLTRKQTKLFIGVLETIKSCGFDPKFIHMSNSAGIHNKCFPLGNLVRPGLYLYGEGDDGLEPVLQWSAQIYDIRTVGKGEGIGYGPLYRASRKSKIATLGVGYADGYPRVLSNKSHVLIRGKKCSIVGAVSMDLLAVDVTKLSNVSVQESAILLGRDGKERITAVDLAQKAKTIPWEILTSISSRVPRLFIR